MKKMRKSFWALLLAVMMLYPLMPAAVSAEGTDDSPSHCPAHTAHDDTCGYAEAKDALPCTFAHQHDDTCGWDKTQDALPCAVEASHVHDSGCGFSKAVAGSPCTHSCDLCSVSADAAAPASDIGIPGGVKGTEGGTTSAYRHIYFGGVVKTDVMNGNRDGEYSDQILWRVLENSSSEMVLLAEYYPAWRRFAPAAGSNNYRDSDIRRWLTGRTVTGDTREFLGNFTDAELAAINRQRAFDSGTGEAAAGVTYDASGDYFWLPSSEEVKGAWFSGGNADRRAPVYADPSKGANWWLRSPGGSKYNNAAYVNLDGGVDDDGESISNYFGVRPAFKLRLSSVLFPSAAAGGKSVNVGDGFIDAGTPAGDWKLTILDSDTDNLNLTRAYVDTKNVIPGTAAKITFEGAKTGGDKVVSCVLLDGDGNVTHYARLSDKESGSASITIPADLSAGSYTLRVYNEQLGGDRQTDYASTPKDIPLEVAIPTAYQHIYFGDVQRTDKDDHGNRDGEYTDQILWRVLDNSNGELMMMPEFFPAFRMFTYYEGFPGHNIYGISDIRSWLNGDAAVISTSREFLNNFTAAELSAINKQRVYDKDGVATETVTADNDGDFFWLLSRSEAENEKYFPSGYADRRARIYASPSDNSEWGLRTPQSDSSSFAHMVNADGDTGWSKITNFPTAIRPAFKLRLSSVLFPSAAEGGKSVNVGDGFIDAGAPAGDWKLTILDNDTGNLSLTSADAGEKTVSPGDTVEITFAGAKIGGGKVVSCVLADESGKVTHYAKLSEKESGSALLSIPADLPPALYTLQVYNEQLSGGKKTDYASRPVNIPLTVKENTPAVTYTVTFISGSTTVKEVPGIQPNQTVGSEWPDTPFKSGNTFGGWFTGQNGAGTQYTKTTPINGDVTLYAKWTPVSGPTYSYRTLTDPITRVKVSGSFSSDAVLAVKKSSLHEKGSCEACGDIRERQNGGGLIVLHDISLSSGKYIGGLIVEIPVGSKHNGREVLMIHCKDKVLERRTVKVENGVAKGSFFSLSPFAVAVPPSGTAAINASTASQTGDTANLLPWLLTMLAVLAGCALLLLYRKRNTKD